MKEAEKKIYIGIKAEVIKHFHDTYNAGKFINGFPMQKALELATVDYDVSVKNNWFDLSLDELLTLSVNDCLILRTQRIDERLKKAIKKHKKMETEELKQAKETIAIAIGFTKSELQPDYWNTDCWGLHLLAFDADWNWLMYAVARVQSRHYYAIENASNISKECLRLADFIIKNKVNLVDYGKKKH